MAGLSTDFNIAPYYDDFDPKKNYVRELFKPSTPVQTRELTQMQTILQDQISKFGDNILKQGTIIDGCEITLHSMFPYVKIKDTETSGRPVNVGEYQDLVVQSSSGLKAVVITTAQGFESRNPDLNTLFVRYINSGTNGNTFTFSPDEVLTVYDQQQRIFSVSIVNGSTGFSNTDVLTFVPAFSIVNTTAGQTFANGFFVGDALSDGANVHLVITSVGTDVDGNKVLGVRPPYSNIVSGDSTQWTVAANTTLVNANTGETAVVLDVLGQKAAGIVTTDSVGQVVDVSISTTGNGYDVAPYATIVSKTASLAQVQSLQLTAKNYVAQVTIANTITIPTGFGYAVTIDEGVIYQKGFFSHVDNQLVIVDKYSNTPSDVCVGFDTAEKVITSNIDTSLLDPASGRSQNAPGADRLQLIPTGVAIDKTVAEANSNFLSLVEFSEGEAYKLDPVTQYNIIGQAMAQRMVDAEGNFVINKFQLATKSANMASENTSFKIVIDPGVAYINGNKVETIRNYVTSVNKGIDSVVASSTAVSVDYGNYVLVTNATGNLFKMIGQTVSLSSSVGAVPAPGVAPTDPGGQIGQARVRAITLETAGAVRVYRLYLFDILMDAGKNFTDIRSIYSSTASALVSTVLASGSTILQEPGQSTGLFSTGQQAVKAVSNVTFTSLDSSSHIVNTDGTIAKTLSGSKKFLYTGSLSASALLDVGLMFEANTQSSANLAGSAVVTSGSNTVSGTSTNFDTQILPGSYIKVANTTANTVLRVASVTNATSLQLSGNAGSSITGNVIAFFPANIPVAVTNGTIDVGQTTLTITLPYPVTAGANATVTAMVNDVNTSIANKTVNRSLAVRIDTSSNEAGIDGPWALGVPDVIRLRKVYMGTNNTFVGTDTGVSDVTASFYIDHNQQADFLNTSYLFKKPRSVASITTGAQFLVIFDALTTSSNGVRTITSYPINDTANLDSLTTQMNTLEVPEVFEGTAYYDLRDQFDFRPVTANTITLTSNTAAAPINPTEPVYANRFTSNFAYPLPKSAITASIEYYQGRSDRIVITEKSKFNIIKGIPGKFDTPKEPENVITINNLLIPPYPSIPQAMSAELAEIADTNIANETFTTRRLNTYKIATSLTDQQIADGQPRGYSMTDIGQIDRRLTNVENFLSFTAAEAAAKNRTIPSSVDGSDRFKFGFFVDTFVDRTYSDVDNPDYAATLDMVNGWLLPKDGSLAIEFSPLPGASPGVPYVETPGVGQGSATGDDDDCGITTDTTEPVQAILSYRRRWGNVLWDTLGSVHEDSVYTFSEKQGPVELYFSFHRAKNSINVYQSKDPSFTDATLIKTASSAVGATNTGTDGTKLPTDLPWSALIKQGTLGSGALAAYAASGSGKITWTHNPDNGLYYKVVIGKFGSTTDADAYLYRGKWAYVFYYPTDADGQDDCEPNTTDHIVYDGHFISILPDKFRPQAVQRMLIPRVGGSYYADAQKFECTVTGLKPLTAHNVIVDSKEVSMNCAPEPGNVGDPIVTDKYGILKFDYYYDAGIASATSDFAVLNKMSASVTGPKTIQVASEDGSSGAEAQIGVKSYIASTSNPLNVNHFGSTYRARQQPSAIIVQGGSNTSVGYIGGVISGGGGGVRDLFRVQNK